MKKILAIAIVAILALALCIGASANSMTSADQVTNVAGADNAPEKNLAKFGGNDSNGTDLGDISDKVPDQKLYLWGWFTTSDAKIEKFGYRYGDNKAVIESEKYETGADVIGAGASIAGDTGETSRFLIEVPVVKGENVELYGVVKLADGTVQDIWKVTYTSTVGADPAAQQQVDDNPDTADASVIAIAAVACIALAGVVVAKKVR